MLYFNGLSEEKQLLTAGRRVLIPGAVRPELLQSEEVTVADVRAMSLESKMRTDPREPVFFVYLATGFGEVLGKLILTDMEVMFDPLGEQFKGHFNYEHGDLLKNTRMGTIINYKDICGEIQKLAFQEVDEDSDTETTVTRFGIQLNLHHTGYVYYSKPPAIEIYEKLREQERPLASLCLKINSHNLTGERLSEDKQEEIADLLIATVEKRIFRAKHEADKKPNKGQVQSMTSVPFFDINYQNLLSVLSPASSDSPDLATVDRHLPILKELFGLKTLGDTLAPLSNQSIYSLGIPLLI